MRWELKGRDAESPGWLQADTTVGVWAVEEMEEGFVAFWFPPWVTGDEIRIGTYRTQGAAKGAAKRYAKRMAAAFKALGIKGWQ